jgi:hypothetical protein
MFTAIGFGLFVLGTFALIVAIDLYQGRHAESKASEPLCKHCDGIDCPNCDWYFTPAWFARVEGQPEQRAPGEEVSAADVYRAHRDSYQLN